MLGFSVEAKEVINNIIRPMLDVMSYDVGSYLGIDNLKTVYAQTEKDVSILPGSRIGDTDRFPKIATDGISVSVDFRESNNPDTYGYTPGKVNSYRPIFHDPNLNVTIRPNYNIYDVDLVFTFKSASKNDILRWLNAIRRNSSSAVNTIEHQFKYIYEIPYEHLLTLATIYNMREQVAGYGDTFEQYLNRYTIGKLVLGSTMNNGFSTWFIEETQTGIQGKFDFPNIPDMPTLDKSSGAYTVDIPYKFCYDKLSDITGIYPISVHNQLLESWLVDIGEDNKTLDTPTTGSVMAAIAGALTNQNAISKGSAYGKTLYSPDYDKHGIALSMPGMFTCVSALCLLEEDRTVLCNLKDLGDVELDLDFIDCFLAGEYQYLLSPFDSIMNVMVYADDKICSDITISSDLVVQSTVPLDWRKQYRVKVNLVTDITLLKKSAIDRLKLNSLIFVKYIESLNQTLKALPNIRSVSAKPIVNALDFNDIYRFVTGLNYLNAAELSRAVSNAPWVESDPLKAIRGNANSRVVGQLYKSGANVWDSSIIVRRK